MTYGWQARLGFILPSDNVVLEPEYYGLGLPGVSYHVVRLCTSIREEMPQAGIEASRVFRELGVDAVGYACAETSFIGGRDTNATIRDGIETATSLPAVTAIHAMVEALEALGIGTVAVAAPYRQDSATALTTYLEQSGMSVAGIETRDFAEGSDDFREWYETNRQPVTAAYELAIAADKPDAEAVLIAATNLPSMEIICRLEQELGKPVISTNSALLWSLLARCGVAVDLPTLGTLGDAVHAR